jgi:triacylglycerol esterase/lipase EstA (alpha/beta hydrolase family)
MSATLAAGSAPAAVAFANSGATLDLTPPNNSQSFTAPSATGEAYYFTFSSPAQYRFDFTASGSLDADYQDNPFVIETGSTPGDGTVVASSAFETYAEGLETKLAAGTYTVYFAHTTEGEAITGNVSVGSVPEPSTWAFMLLGVGVVGGVMRRRASPVMAPMSV